MCCVCDSVLVMYNNCCSVSVGGSHQFCEGGSQLCVVSVTKSILVMYDNCCSVSVGGSQWFCQGVVSYVLCL